MGVVAAAATAAVTLILIGSGVETAPVIATPIGGGGGRAVSISAVAAVEAAASVFVAAAGAHAAVALILVHEVGVAGVASTVTHPTSASTATIGVDQLKQLRVDGLSGLLQDSDQVPGLPQVPWCEEGVGGALVGAAGRTANTVDVVL